MKKIKSILFFFTIASCLSTVAYAQWTTSGTNIYNSNSGNVGIKTSSPSGALHVNGSGLSGWTYFQGNIQGAGNPSNISGLQLGWNKSNAQGESLIVYNTSTGSAPRIDFSSFNGTTFLTEMTLKAGSLGLGTTTPVGRMHIMSPAAGGHSYLRLEASSSYQSGLDIATAGATKFYVFNDNGSALKIRSTGSASETDALPRMQFPFATTDIYMAQSGGKVGIGTSTPAYTLDVNGTINSISNISSTLKITGGTPGVGKVLTSDANGVATWQAPTGGSSAWTTSGSNIYFNTAGGNVGIGTTAPTAPLHVNLPSSGVGLLVSGGSAPGNISLQVNNSGVLGAIEAGIGSPQTEVRIGSKANYNLALFANDIDRITILKNNGYVGINTATPAYQLDVNGTINATGILVNGQAISGSGNSQWAVSGSNIYFNTSGAFVGIGTATPGYSLDVNGTVNSSSLIAGSLKITGGVPGAGKVLTSDAAGNATWSMPAGSGWTASGTNINYATGNVGIGSSNPDAKLTVNGTIHTSEVKIDLSVPGPDYVFEKEYELIPLNEVKDYINNNKHLPEIPSAKEMEKNGVQLGEMNMMLLKKIEELTLYLIKAEEQIGQLDKKVSDLEKKIKK